MKIEIVIPNFNGSHLIQKNLPDVLESVRGYTHRVTIVDDASTNTDFKKLEEYVQSFSSKENIHLIRQKKNRGFAGTVNNAALASTAEFLIFLNSDVAPTKNFLKSPLQQFEQNPQLFGVGCMDQSIEHGNVILRGRGIGRFERGFLIHSKGAVDKANTLWISGGSCIVRTTLFQRLGGFDAIYSPFYWEDIDLSYRAVKSGYSLLFDQNSVVEHRHEEGAIKSHFTDYAIKTIAYRNQILFMWKNITDAAIWQSHIVYLPYHIGHAVAKADIAFLKGFFQALVKIPAVSVSRQRQKKLYTLPDREVVSLVHEKS